VYPKLLDKNFRIEVTEHGAQQIKKLFPEEDINIILEENGKYYLNDKFVNRESVRFALRKYDPEGNSAPLYGEQSVFEDAIARHPADGFVVGNTTNFLLLTDAQGFVLDGFWADIDAEDLQGLADAARQYWADAGVSWSALENVRFCLEALPEGIAGQQEGNVITLDDNGAGRGWYVDPSPEDALEFTNVSELAPESRWYAAEGSNPDGKLDMLSVLIHELGHVLGLRDRYNDSQSVMASHITPGERRIPSAEDIASVCALHAMEKSETFHTDSAWDTSADAMIRQYEIVANPEFADAQFENGTGWSTTGTVRFANGEATLKESLETQTRLNQVFVVGEDDRYLRFQITDLVLDDADNAPDDAFEAALIDANTGRSLLSGTGLTKNDAFINLQANGDIFKSNKVTAIDNPDGSRTVIVDLEGIPVGTVVNLSFDLIGFGFGAAATNSHVTIGSLRLGETEEPGTDEPGTDEPGTDEPGTDEPGTDEPGTNEPGTNEPGTNEPGTDEPGTDEPGTDEPGTDEPGTSEPGMNEPETGGSEPEEPGAPNVPNVPEQGGSGTDTSGMTRIPSQPAHGGPSMPPRFQTTVWHNPIMPRSGSAGVPSASPSAFFPATSELAFMPVAEAQAEAALESGTKGEATSKPGQPRQTPGCVLRLGMADPLPGDAFGEAYAQGGDGHSREEQTMLGSGNAFWVWKVAAIAITLTAAALVARRVMTGAGAGMPWAAGGLRRGGLVTLECLAEGEQKVLNPLVAPRHGKLSHRGNACVYQPKANRKGEDSFTCATKAGVATLRLMLEADTKAFTRVAYVMSDALPSRQGVPLRLTVQSEREAPTLILTDRAPGALLVSRCEEGEAIMLAAIKATAQHPENTLSVELGGLPEGSILSDSNNTFTATSPNATVDITGWHCDQLTLTPQQDSPSEFTLRVQVTETGEATGEQKTLETVAGLRVMTQPVKPENLLDPDEDLRAKSPETVEEAVAARPGASATITIRSMPKPPTLASRQGGYIILNHGPHAKLRPKVDKAHKPETAVPTPRIDWNAEAPDLGKVTSPAWVAECFDRLKEKPKTLGEITGLVFKMDNDS
jgi:hypothetical protein